MNDNVLLRLMADPKKLLKKNEKKPSKYILLFENFMISKYKLDYTDISKELFTHLFSLIDKEVNEFHHRQFVSEFVNTCITNAIIKYKIDTTYKFDKRM
jgi:hypothetical protein